MCSSDLSRIDSGRCMVVEVDFSIGRVLIIQRGIRHGEVMLVLFDKPLVESLSCVLYEVLPIDHPKETT